MHRYLKRKRADDGAPEVEVVIERKSARLTVHHEFAEPDLERLVRALPVVEEVEPGGAPCLLRQPEVVVHGVCCRQRRNVGFFSDESAGYAYSGGVVPAQPLAGWMADAMLRVNDRLGTSFNGILLNHYPDGDSTIGAHADDEHALDKKRRAVAAISFGAVRKFRVRDRATRDIVRDLPTVPLSLMVMEGDFQSAFTHEIPVEKKVREPRWSMTFRSHVE